jgi:hypothetical protein
MTIRDIQARAARSVFRTLGAEVKYHHVGGVVSTVHAIESVSPEFIPDGLMSQVQESETVYHVNAADIPSPAKGDFIVDGTKRFDVVTVEPTDRYKFALIVREVI